MVLETSLAHTQPARPPVRLARLPAFWLALLALLLLGVFESRFIAWCWPAYGEAACSRYSLPLNFLIDLAFFLLVVLVFDRRGWAMLLAGVLAVAVYHAASLPGLAQNVAAGAGSVQSIFPLAGWAFMALYLALLRFILPALILRWLARRAGELSKQTAFLFGALIAVFAAACTILLFGGAAVLSPGSVAPGTIFTPLGLAGALLTGLAAWLTVRLGSKLRTKTR